MSKPLEGVKRKTADFSLKMLSPVDEETGTFEGYASIFNNVDQSGDMVMPGAFARTLHNKLTNGKSFPLLWQHDTFEPIGLVTSAVEDANGLKFVGKLIMESDAARQRYALLKAGAITGVSIGYDTIACEYPDDLVVDGKQCYRQLKEIRLWEVSLATFPCNEEATVTNVKSKDGNMEEKSAEELKYAAELTSTMGSLNESIRLLMERMNSLSALTNTDAQPAPAEPVIATVTSDPVTPIVTETPVASSGDPIEAIVTPPVTPDIVVDVAVDLTGCDFVEMQAIQNAIETTTSLSAEIASLREGIA